ncbi:hypothetical protein [Streptomyces sp. NPDC057325]|uniref:hypothetical protein n=1 Tax=unclassified Streptomyces TaxID=2593676 RepID=UPI00362D468C
MPSRHAVPGAAIPAHRPAREAAEAALVEHYPALVRLAYLVLPPALGRHRRVLAAHALVQNSLAETAGRPKDGTPLAGASLPGQRSGERPAHAWLRATVVRAALRPPRRFPPPFPFPLPLVLGLRLFPRAGGTDELALDRALAEAAPATRAALALRTLEGLPADAAARLLASAGVTDPAAALRAAERIGAASGTDVETLLHSAEFDPCTVHTRPTDLLRRRRHTRLAALAGALLLVTTGVAVTAGVRAGTEAEPAASRAVPDRTADPAALVRTPADRWADTSRVDLTAWPARGAGTRDTALLRRALEAWARGAGDGVRLTAAPDTPVSPPAEPPRLLFAGPVDGAAVVLLHDGRRLARYTEPRDGRGPAALDLARADDSDVTTGAAVALTRTAGRARYLLAPWIAEAAVRDLGAPGTAARPLDVTPDGVTGPVPYGVLSDPGRAPSACAGATALQLRSSTRIVEDHAFLLADLGELVPAHLTWTPPPGADVPARAPREATGARGLAAWARSACSLAPLHGAGIRSVNRWEYAEQPLPERAGRALWVCSRVETWEGSGRASVSFEAPGGPAPRPVADLRDTAACGRFGQHVLAGAYWTAPSGTRYLLAAGSRRLTGVTAGGAVTATARGPFLAARAAAEGPARLMGRLPEGSVLPGFDVLPGPTAPQRFAAHQGSADRRGPTGHEGSTGRRGAAALLGPAALP